MKSIRHFLKRMDKSLHAHHYLAATAGAISLVVVLMFAIVNDSIISNESVEREAMESNRVSVPNDIVATLTPTSAPVSQSKKIVVTPSPKTGSPGAVQIFAYYVNSKFEPLTEFNDLSVTMTGHTSQEKMTFTGMPSWVSPELKPDTYLLMPTKKDGYYIMWYRCNQPCKASTNELEYRFAGNNLWNAPFLDLRENDRVDVYFMYERPEEYSNKVATITPAP